MKNRINATACAVCGDPEAPLVIVGDTALCHDCEIMERTTDWDKFEEDKRRRIAEENEY